MVTSSPCQGLCSSTDGYLILMTLLGAKSSRGRSAMRRVVHVNARAVVQKHCLCCDVNTGALVHFEYKGRSHMDQLKPQRSIVKCSMLDKR
jgi:hypothetical protein